MRYGHFDEKAGEYVIERPDTPLPWSNYMGSADFGAVLTNHAGGYTFYKSAAQGRLSRFRFNALPAANPGKYVYLRDRASGDFWSNAWFPVAKPPETYGYECRFGTGYAKFRSSYAGIESETAYFIPLDALYEVWRVTVRNAGASPRRLSVFPFLEPQCNWNALDDNTNLQYTQYIAQTSLEDGMLDIGSNVHMPPDPEHFQNKDQQRHTFFGLAGAEASAHDGDLSRFLGVYGSYAAPLAVARGSCGGSHAYGDHPCAAFQVDLDLAPGEARTFCVLFGVGRAADQGAAARRAMARDADVLAALDGVRGHWHGRLGSLKARTPDPQFDAMVNLWAPYNNLMTYYWARTASLVYAGERDGLGYRDAVQDLAGASALIPGEAGRRLELLLTGQLASGGAMTIVKPFDHRPGHERGSGRYRSDDCLWLFNAAPEYVKETGDLDFFRKTLPYADQGLDTVLGHLRRAIQFNLDRSGGHGLPCGLEADWNDCLRFGETGETTFVAFQLRLALREYAEIAGRLGEADERGWARDRLSALDAALAEHAWDGGWYLRGYRADGFKFGSRGSDEGQIFVNPQSWSVLSGHAGPDRGRQAMDAVRERLFTPHGIAICQPAFVHTDHRIVLARLLNPGQKENGGIFNHVQGWAVMAEAELGRPDRAWEYLRAALPCNFNDIAEVRQVEPYAVCQSTQSRSSPHFGVGRVSWLSGSAVWNYYAMTHAILGIRPHYDGLEIKPCLPSGWAGYTATRRFRGREFRIEVTRGGEPSLRLNGRPVEGTLLPADAFADRNEARAVIAG